MILFELYLQSGTPINADTTRYVNKKTPDLFILPINLSNLG